MRRVSVDVAGRNHPWPRRGGKLRACICPSVAASTTSAGRRCFYGVGSSNGSSGHSYIHCLHTADFPRRGAHVGETCCVFDASVSIGGLADAKTSSQCSVFFFCHRGHHRATLISAAGASTPPRTAYACLGRARHWIPWWRWKRASRACRWASLISQGAGDVAAWGRQLECLRHSQIESVSMQVLQCNESHGWAVRAVS